MTDRLGLQTRDELDAATQEIYDAFVKYTENKYAGIFKSRDDFGRFLGPFGVLLHTPAVAKAYMPMIAAVAGIGGLDAEARETAILVVGSKTGAKYETYAHEPVSGFTRAELDDILAGRCPDGFNEKRRTAYQVTEGLLAHKGPLSDDMWQQGVKVFGTTGMTSLVHYVGFYSYVAILLNGFDTSIPSD